MGAHTHAASRVVAIAAIAAAATVGTVLLVISRWEPAPARLTIFDPSAGPAVPVTAGRPVERLDERGLLQKAVRDERQRQGEISLERRGRDGAAR